MTRDEAKTFLEQNLEPVWTYLFPAAKRDGAHFVVGNIEGAPGESFRVCLQGANRGLYKDFASGEKASRDLIGLWMKARCVQFQTALSEIAASPALLTATATAKNRRSTSVRHSIGLRAFER
jgi:twinkle protein